jgi:hypothetical protein
MCLFIYIVHTYNTHIYIHIYIYACVCSPDFMQSELIAVYLLYIWQWFVHRHRCRAQRPKRMKGCLNMTASNRQQLH